MLRSLVGSEMCIRDRFHLQLYLNCIFTYVLISFSHGYSATLAAKLIIKLDLTFICLLLRSICGTENSLKQTSLQCLTTINMVFSNEDKILIKSLYSKGYTAKRLTGEFPVKIWQSYTQWELFSETQCMFTFRMRRSRGEMYIGHSRLCVRVSVCPSPHSHTTAWTQM